MQQLLNQSRENYNFDNSSNSNPDIKNYMTIYRQPTSNLDVALLDSESIHIILTNFFEIFFK